MARRFNINNVADGLVSQVYINHDAEITAAFSKPGFKEYVIDLITKEAKDTPGRHQILTKIGMMNSNLQIMTYLTNLVLAASGHATYGRKTMI